MPAKIDTEFKRGFILSEENLAKIDDIIRKRLESSSNDFSLKYEVHRTDDALITYQVSSEVIEEENSKRNCINGVTINAKSNGNKLQLIFRQGSDTKLVLEAEDRDLALLLTADLKEYLNSEVFVRKFSKLVRLLDSKNFFLFFMLIAFLPLVLFTMFIDQPDSLNLAVATVDEKLNFLVQRESANDALNSRPYLSFFPIFLILSAIFLTSTASFLYPTDIFYWGKEVSRFDKQRSLRSKIFWSVFVACAVGLTTAYLYDRA